MARFWHKWHRVISIFIALPFLLTITTGILLISRSFNPWVQPRDRIESRSELKISFAQILESAKTVPEAQVQSWQDISQIEARPANGSIHVRTKTQWDIQVDGATGQVLTNGYHRLSLLTALHEGAYFGKIVHFGIFLPMALGVLFLLISGVVIYLQPFFKKKIR